MVGLHENKTSNLKWVSIIFAIIATIILLNDVLTAGKLSGAGLAQSGFGMFLDFIVYAIPSISLVCFCLYKHVKSMFTKHVGFFNIISDLFVVSSVIIILVPIFVFIFS